MQTPKLSIITVNLNNAEGLKKTIESVVSQTFSDYEYIIIDGGSTDGSKEIIEKYADKITYWVSEPDNGIYNGMNKGIKIAKGEYINFLNSGDTYISEKVLENAFSKNYSEDILYGNIKTETQNFKFPEKLTLKSFFKGTIGHSSSFIKKTLFETYGLYNENFKIVSDWAFFTDVIINKKCSYKYLKEYITFFEGGGISWDKEYFPLQQKERREVLKKLFPDLYNDYDFFYNEIEELKYYKKSKIIQFAKRIQKSKIYKLLRKEQF